VPRDRKWSARIGLIGAGGEPVDFARTLLSHGVADLPPNEIDRAGAHMETVLPVGDRAWVVRLQPDGPRAATLDSPNGVPSVAARASLVAQVKHMLRLDEDLSAFYAVAAEDVSLSWVASGAGRMVRSPTVFEDVVKTICTTNCTWSATERMVGAIVRELGTPARRDPGRERRAFPSAEAMAETDPRFYTEVARAGYRGPYLRALATDVAEGTLDLEAFNDPDLPDAEVAERLLAIAGVGPYAMAHMMMLLGRYQRLILDSWTRPTYRRLTGRARITDKGIERAFRRYREFAGLAFWLTLTESWVTQAESAS
jgi:3-methyladenine DNA glycosylase/8-oxoguanine DNA glycosylase